MEEISLPEELIILRKERFFMWSELLEVLNPYKAVRAEVIEQESKKKKTKTLFSRLIQKLRA